MKPGKSFNALDKIGDTLIKLKTPEYLEFYVYYRIMHSIEVPLAPFILIRQELQRSLSK